MGVMLWRARASASSVVRLQARIVLFGSLLGFTPLTLWFVAPLLGAQLPFDTLLLLPGLVIFPAAVTVAIIRHRLLEVEVIVNRTIFYGALTAVLTAVYTVSISISQKLFTALTGERSDAAIVLTTLFVVSLFVPFKTRMQVMIDTRFKEAPDNTRALSHFGAEVHAFFQMSDAQQITRRLLEEAARSLQAESGAFTRVNGGGLEAVHTYGRWTGDARICLPLECNGTRYGLLCLGPRRSQKQYTRRECETLEQTVSRVAQVVHWSHLTFPSPE
jgi:hypothetical protein